MTDSDYLVTDDVVQTLENRLDYDLTAQERAEINASADQYFRNEMPEVVPDGMNYTVIDAADCIQWAEDVMDSNVPVVSVDNTYFPGDSEAFDVTELGLTRETDPATGEYVLAARNPEVDYEEKLAKIAAQNDEVQIFDGGAFTGGTLQRVTEDLRSQGVEVNQTVIPIAGQQALQDDLNPLYMQSFKFGDWLEGRDIAAIDGRKLPADQRADEPRTFIPYWEDPEGMASIGQQDSENAERFEEMSREFNQKIEEIVGEEVGNRVEAEW